MTTRDTMPTVKIDRSRCRECSLCNLRFPGLPGGGFGDGVKLPVWADLEMTLMLSRLKQDCPDQAISVETDIWTTPEMDYGCEVGHAG